MLTIEDLHEFDKAVNNLDDNLTLFQISLFEFIAKITETSEYDSLFNAGFSAEDITTHIYRLKDTKEKYKEFKRYLDDYYKEDTDGNN